MERTPWATISIIALCALIEGLALANPGLRDLLATNPEAFHWWQPLTSMFAHADPMHLIGNMVFFWVFASHVEDTIGIPKFLALYVATGLAADWSQAAADLVFLHHIQGSIGASGAIMGLFALFVVRYRNVNVNCFYWYYMWMGTWQIKAIYLGAIYVGLDFLQGLGTGSLGVGGGVAYFAHVGGFAAGVACAYMLRLPTAAAVEEDRDTAAGFAAAGAYAAAAGAMAEAVQHSPADPDLRRQLATYLDMKANSAHLAVPEWNCAFRLWLSRGEPETALENWHKATGVHAPQEFDPQVVFDLAIILDKREHDTEAATAYAALVQHRRDFAQAPLAALRLGDLLVAHGRPDQARHWYEYLRATWPDAEEALTAEGKLARLQPAGGASVPHVKDSRAG
ncbi:MAG: rhomboid family intramembrane serine protease [Armatimonadetes bacterium]|nr:rhomboid family intramembrane serine protease [Armatimonadota bacterium]